MERGSAGAARNVLAPRSPSGASRASETSRPFHVSRLRARPSWKVVGRSTGVCPNTTRPMPASRYGAQAAARRKRRRAREERVADPQALGAPAPRVEPLVGHRPAVHQHDVPPPRVRRERPQRRPEVGRERVDPGRDRLGVVPGSTRRASIPTEANVAGPPNAISARNSSGHARQPAEHLDLVVALEQRDDAARPRRLLAQPGQPPHEPERVGPAVDHVAGDDEGGPRWRRPRSVDGEPRLGQQPVHRCAAARGGRSRPRR